jgi:hypothetical protein
MTLLLVYEYRNAPFGGNEYYRIVDHIIEMNLRLGCWFLATSSRALLFIAANSADEIMIMSSESGIRIWMPSGRQAPQRPIHVQTGDLVHSQMLYTAVSCLFLVPAYVSRAVVVISTFRQ